MVAHKLTDSRIQVIKKILENYDHLNETNDEYDTDPKKWIKKFQYYHQLPNSGQLDQKTRSKLDELLSGYTIYHVEDNEQLYDIANQFNTSNQRIITANPEINPFFLEKNYKLIIPSNNSIVRTDTFYNYEIMEKNIIGLGKRFPFIKYDVIGKSIEGRKLYRISLGEGTNHVLYNGSHHGCEWITTLLLMKWIEEFCESYAFKGSVNGFKAEQIWKKTTIHIVPMVNPDGVELSINGLEGVVTNKRLLKKWNNGNEDFSTWKANINGVDLNRNYNAKWYDYKKLEQKLDILGPSSSSYSGRYPHSEPETKAMVNLTKSVNPRLTLAFHSQGKEIFWNFRDMQPRESLKIAMELCNISGYLLGEEDLEQSYAGYKDWIICEMEKPSFTIEVGEGKNPLPLSQFQTIYEDNVGLLFLASII